MLQSPWPSAGAAPACARSFVHRKRCCLLARSQAQRGGWAAVAANHREESLRLMPTNANSLYIKGQERLQSGRPQEAAAPLLRSLLLDPDFKAAYISLGICYLRQGAYQEAIATCEAGFSRHPIPHFRYHMGLAYFQLATQTPHQTSHQDRRRRALEHLTAARESPEARRVAQGRAPWSEEDGRMVSALATDRALPFVALSPTAGWVAASIRI